MTASDLITMAFQKGLILTLEGEFIRVRGPQANPEAAALIEQIRNRKPEVVQALKSSGAGMASPRAWVVEESRAGGDILRAFKVCSVLLEAHLWIVLDSSFDPGDDLAVYYTEELPILVNKTPQQLREIHNVKVGVPGSKVRQ